MVAVIMARISEDVVRNYLEHGDSVLLANLSTSLASYFAIITNKGGCILLAIAFAIESHTDSSITSAMST